MNVSSIAIYGKKVLLVIITLSVMSGCFFLHFLMLYMQSSVNGIILGSSLLFLILCLLYLIRLVSEKISIHCDLDTITVKSSFLTTKERHMTLSKTDCLLLRCEESERFKRCDLFRSRVRMPVIPIYYVIKTEDAGEPILRFSEKQAALETFDYICRSFPNIEKRIDLSDEKNILKERKLLWSSALMNFYLFASIATCFISLVLFFASFCIYPTVFETNWVPCKVHVERVQDRVAYVWVPDSKQQKRLTCSVRSDELPTLREAANKKEELQAYMALGDPPELRLTAPNDASDFVLFLSIACGMLFVSTVLSFQFFRTRKKLRWESSVIYRDNALISW